MNHALVCVIFAILLLLNGCSSTQSNYFYGPSQISTDTITVPAKFVKQIEFEKLQINKSELLITKVTESIQTESVFHLVTNEFEFQSFRAKVDQAAKDNGEFLTGKNNHFNVYMFANKPNVNESFTTQPSVEKVKATKNSFVHISKEHFKYDDRILFATSTGSRKGCIRFKFANFDYGRIESSLYSVGRASDKFEEKKNGCTEKADIREFLAYFVQYFWRYSPDKTTSKYQSDAYTAVLAPYIRIVDNNIKTLTAPALQTITELPDGMAYRFENTGKSTRVKFLIKSDSKAFGLADAYGKIPDEYHSFLATEKDLLTSKEVLIWHRNPSTNLPHEGAIKHTLEYLDLSNITKKIQEAEKQLIQHKQLVAQKVEAGTGFIKLTSNETEVDVYIDEKLHGTIKHDRPFVAELPVNKHRIRVAKRFFGSKSITIDLHKDDAFAYHFELIPSGNMQEKMGTAKIVQSIGTLSAVTSRNDLKVAIEDAIYIPPFKLPNIASGSYEVEITGPGIDKKLKVTVEENKTTILRLDDLIND